MGEEIKKLTHTGYIQRPAYNLCCGIFTAQNGTEEDLMFNYNWVNNPEAQNKNGEYVYIDEDNASNSESIVDLIQNDYGEACDEDTYYDEWVVEYVNLWD
ncbi:2140_t:CDS:2 [Racocetra fulgida]|uniref:2140_t:CDS:1 n=1 Tax=Racocetra fulgida TaxID=60492 RepID=A0A9N9AXW9_9GLOM|nr:2140_t:CDS:2 [Racocetra fulgida]